MSSIFAAVLAAVLAAVTAATLAAGPAAGQIGFDQDAALSCLDDPEQSSALSVDLITRAPSAICAPQQRVVELRNRSGAPLGDVRLRLGADVGVDARGRERLSLTPLSGAGGSGPLFGDQGPFFEISRDDGATWAPVALPLGRGAETDPFVFSVDETALLNRIGPAGAPDDSLLLRWRAAAGAAYAGPMTFEPEVFLGASARDACGRRVEAPARRAALPLLQPALGATIVGRNATRGGAFGRRVTAAPDDVVEWRVEIENAGDAAAASARIDLFAGRRLSPDMARLGLTAGPAPADSLAPVDPVTDRTPLSGLIQSLDGGGERRAGARVELGAILSEGRRAVLLRETVGRFCGARAIFASPSWSCGVGGQDAAGAVAAGDAGAVESPGWAAGRALLETAPDPARIRIIQTVRGVDGQLEPGDLAEVVARVANSGAPAFAPRLAVDLPDGYEIDLRFSPVFVDAEGVRRPARVDRSDPTAPVFDVAVGISAPGLAASDSAQAAGAALDTDRPVSILYRIRRTRPSLTAADDLVSTLLYEDACGAADSSRSTRTRVASRRAELTAVIEPERDALAPAPGEVKRVGLVIGNRGLENADAVRVRLTLGSGWALLRDERCRAETPIRSGDTPTGAGAWTYMCALADGAPRGSSQRLSFELTGAADPDAPPPSGAPLAAGALPPFGVRAVVEALRAGASDSAAGPAATDVVARAEAEAALLGFALTQRLLSETGAPRENSALELGERAILEVEAVWYGAPLDRLTTASLTQTPPPSLAFRTVRAADAQAIGRRSARASWPAELAAEARLTPPVGAPGPIYWSLQSPSDASDAQNLEPDEAPLHLRFVGRVEVEAVDPAASAAPAPVVGDDGPRADDIAAVASVFLFDGVAYGVDAAAAETAAAALPVAVRRPGVSLSVTLETPEGEPIPRDARGRYLVSPVGRAPRARFRVQNAGDGPAYLDWAALEARPGLGFAPLGRDGVDNDGDGAVDEADESTSATFEQRAGGATLRWLATPAASDSRRNDAVSLGAAAQRIDPGGSAEWVVALSVDPELPPGSDLSLGLSGRFGALPFAETGGAARVVARSEALAVSDGVGGFLTLVDASRAGVLSRRVTHGEQVTHRARLTAPPGRVANLELIVDMPPAFTAVEPLSRSVGPAFDCVDWAPPGVEQRAVGGGEADGGGGARLVWRLVWRLGDCVVRAGPDGVRSAFLDIAAVAQDADPLDPPAARRAWRRAELSAWARYIGRAPDGAPRLRLEALGRERLRVVGPLLALRAAQPRFAGGAPDAGDEGEARIEIENVGDQPADYVSLRLEADRGGPLDCAGLSLRFPTGGFDALRADETGCAVEALSSEGAGVAPGDRIALTAALRLAAAAPIGAEAGAELRLSAAPGAGGAGQFFRPARRRLDAQTAPAGTPALRARVAGSGPSVEGGAAPWAGFGDRVRATASVELPEGVASGEVAVRLRAFRTDAIETASAGAPRGEGDDAAPQTVAPAEALALALRGLRANLFVDGQPLPAPAAAAGGARPVVRAEPDGWVSIVRPFEALALGPAGPSPRRRRVSLVADFAVGAAAVAGAETPLGIEATPASARALETFWRDGAQLEAAAAVRLGGHGGPEVDAVSPARTVFELAEPRIDAVALIESDLFAVPDASGGPGAQAAAAAGWTDGGEIGLGELARFVARVCNRGRAPAFDVSLVAQLPAGFEPAGAGAPEASLRAAPLFAGDRLRWSGGGFEARTGPELPLEPGSCASVSALARAAPGLAPPGLGDASPQGPGAFEVSVVSARAGRGGDPGLRRVYRDLARAVAAPRRAALRVEGPRQSEARAGRPVVLPFAVSAPGALQPLRLTARVTDRAAAAGADLGTALEWTLYRDVDRDGAAGPADAPLSETETLEPGGRLSLVAVAQAPDDLPPGWRGAAALRVSAASASENASPPAPVTAERLVALAARPAGAARPTPVVATQRLMALDRDCDGSLSDETSQDAAFETAKAAEIGQCLHFRIVFVNRGDGPIVDVTVEESPPSAAELTPGSLGFEQTPPGLVAGQAEVVGPPGARRLVFRFVGALAPGRRGAIGYRARVRG